VDRPETESLSVTGPRLELPQNVRAIFPFESHWAEIGGYTLHYIDEGERDAPVVVLLHGNPTWSFVYREFIPYITGTGFRAIVPDYLGFGLSDKPTDENVYAIQHHVGRLVALLDHLTVERAVLFCQDWGGPIGMGACIARPRLLNGIVLANTFWGEASTFQHRVPFWRALHGPIAGPLLLGRRGMFVNAIKLSAPPDMPDAVWDAYQLPFAEASSRVGTLAFPRAISMGPGHPTQPLADAILEALPTWDLPVRLVWGSDDAVFPADEQGAKFVELLPRATLEHMTHIEGARHFVQEYAPRECARAVIDVCEEAF
jgi:pimeloyl-ACP methyl ester carboxylesterase